MKLFDILKQFKSIEPDRGYAERSRREILAAPQSERLTMRGVFAFLHAIETGAAVALAGLFMLILTGSFSNAPAIVPIQSAVIDPQVLHAEAQAVDMQIQLANIEYAQVTSTDAQGSTPATAGAVKPAFTKALAVQATSSAAAGSDATSTASTTPMAVDQALEQLTR